MTPLQLDPSPHRPLERPAPGRHGHRLGEQRQDPRRRRPPALVEVEHLGDLRQRPEQALRHEDQHGVDADGEVATQRSPASDEEGAGEAGEDRHPHEGHEGGREPDGTHVRLAVGGRDGRDAVPLARLRGEGLDGRHSREVRRQCAGQVRNRRPDVGIERLETALEDQRAGDDHRDRQEREQEQLPRGDREDGTDQDDVERRLQDGRRSDVEEPLELVDVVVERRQGRPGGPGLVPPDMEVLGVVVGLHAQVVLDPLREPAPQHTRDILRHGLDDPDHDVERREPAELREARLDPEQRPDERVPTAHHHIDGSADEQLRHDVGDLVHRRGDDRADEPPPVRPIAHPQGAQRLLRHDDGGGRCAHDSPSKAAGLGGRVHGK